MTTPTDITEEIERLRNLFKIAIDSGTPKVRAYIEIGKAIGRERSYVKDRIALTVKGRDHLLEAIGSGKLGLKEAISLRKITLAQLKEFIEEKDRKKEERTMARKKQSAERKERRRQEKANIRILRKEQRKLKKAQDREARRQDREARERKEIDRVMRLIERYRDIPLDKIEKKILMILAWKNAINENNQGSISHSGLVEALSPDQSGTRSNLKPGEQAREKCLQNNNYTVRNAIKTLEQTLPAYGLILTITNPGENPSYKIDVASEV